MRIHWSHEPGRSFTRACDTLRRNPGSGHPPNADLPGLRLRSIRATLPPTQKEEAPMNVSDAIAEVLRREGVETVIGYPVNHILERGAAAGIRPILVRQERTGLHMADAMSRVTSGDKLGVFVMQHGPGTENSYGAVAQAFGDSIPVLVMPGGYPRQRAWVERNYNASVQMRS